MKLASNAHIIETTCCILGHVPSSKFKVTVRGQCFSLGMQRHWRHFKFGRNFNLAQKRGLRMLPVFVKFIFRRLKKFFFFIPFIVEAACRFDGLECFLCKSKISVFNDWLALYAS